MKAQAEWFVFGIVLIAILYDFAPRVAGVFIVLIVTYVLLIRLGPIFKQGTA